MNGGDRLSADNENLCCGIVQPRNQEHGRRGCGHSRNEKKGLSSRRGRGGTPRDHESPADSYLDGDSPGECLHPGAGCSTFSAVQPSYNVRWVLQGRFGVFVHCCISFLIVLTRDHVLCERGNKIIYCCTEVEFLSSSRVVSGCPLLLSSASNALTRHRMSFALYRGQWLLVMSLRLAYPLEGHSASDHRTQQRLTGETTVWWNKPIHLTNIMPATGAYSTAEAVSVDPYSRKFVPIRICPKPTHHVLLSRTSRPFMTKSRQRNQAAVCDTSKYEAGVQVAVIVMSREGQKPFLGFDGQRGRNSSAAAAGENTLVGLLFGIIGTKKYDHN